MKKLGLLLLLLSLSLSYGYSDSKKIVKDILFDGVIVNNIPYGQGKLMILNKNAKDGVLLVIEGIFNGNNIKNGRIIHNLYQQRTSSYTSNYSNSSFSDSGDFDNVEGDFSYTFDNKWKIIEINAYSMKVMGTPNINLGKIKIIKDKNYDFAPNTCSCGIINVNDYNPDHMALIYLIGKKRSESFVEKGFVFGMSKDKPLLQISALHSKAIKFSDNSILIYGLNNKGLENEYRSPKGNTITFRVSNNRMDVISFKIKGADKIVYKGKYDPELSMDIKYPDGSKYIGSIENSLIENNLWGTDVLDKIESITKSDISFFSGTYTKKDGETTEYKEGMLKSEFEKQSAIQMKELTLEKEKINFALLGIPIGGTVSSFNTRLMQEGCERITTYKDDMLYGMYRFKGKVLDRDGYIYVYYDEASKLVYKVKASIYRRDYSAWTEYVNLSDEKYGLAYDENRSNVSKAPYLNKVYTNSKHSLNIDIDYNANSTCYINFNYTNKENYLKKIKTDLQMPSLDQNINSFLASYKKKGKTMKKGAGYFYNINILGRKAYLDIDCDGNGQIDNIKLSCYCSTDQGESRAEDYYAEIKNGLDIIYNNGNKSQGEIYYKDNMKIIYYVHDGSLYVKYIKVKPKRAGGDI